MAAAPSPRARILVVEDDRASRELLVEWLEQERYAVEAMGDGEEAWRRLSAGEPSFDAVLLDWMIPSLDGLALLKRVKADAGLATLPVIFQTARDDRASMLDAIEAGAYYFVGKPIDRQVLISILHTAVEDHDRYAGLQERLRSGANAVATLEEGRFRLQSLVQATALATLLSRACPDPERTVVGLSELLVNAVEHGNLGISYVEKSRHLAAGDWDDEVERRLALAENRWKFVEVRFERRVDEIAITITDQGPGFDWRRYLSVAPERILDRHGRGIAMANLLSFHSLEYRPPGNEVRAVVRSTPRTDPRVAAGR